MGSLEPVEKKKRPPGPGRKVGQRNKKTIQRMADLRRYIGMGLPDHEVRERLHLTKKQWYRLLAVQTQDSGGETNMTYWMRFRDRHDLRVREAMRLLASAHGVDNPSRLRGQDGLPVDPRDAFLEKPDVDACVKVLRLLMDLDEQKLEVGLRLSVFSREPAKVLLGRMPEELTDEELSVALADGLRQVAVELQCSEAELLRLFRQGDDGTVLDARELGLLESPGKGNGSDGNGTSGPVGGPVGAAGMPGGNGTGGPAGAPTGGTGAPSTGGNGTGGGGA